MKEFYEIDIKGLKRELTLCSLNDSLKIGAFIMFGDVELTKHCAAELLKVCPEHDVIITAESKGIPLCYEMTAQEGKNHYVVARKAAKLYMKQPFYVDVRSITTDAQQRLWLDEGDVKAMNGRRVLIVDDVISTGESLHALEVLVEKAGGIIVGKAAVLAEGDAFGRADIISLQYLPLFNAEGEPLN